VNAHPPGCSHAAEPLAALTERLRDHAMKVTGPRQAILRFLRHQSKPLTVKEIHLALADGECNLATVYRAMNRLSGNGLVKRLDFGDGVARFELIAQGDTGHHHHLICTHCATIVKIEECMVTDVEQQIARASGFARVTHALEFFGLCPQCQ
jgi:Fur family ferric uptake transcriptional regulator